MKIFRNLGGQSRNKKRWHLEWRQKKVVFNSKTRMMKRVCNSWMLKIIKTLSMWTYKGMLMAERGIVEKKRQWYKKRYMNVTFLRRTEGTLERGDYCIVYSLAFTL